MNEECDRLNKLVEDASEMSRLEAGEIELEFHAVPVQELIDTALAKRAHLTEHVGLELGAEAFNILNHPQLAGPGANISSTSSFGKITAPINTSPVGAGTPRQVQTFVRLSF